MSDLAQTGINPSAQLSFRDLASQSMAVVNDGMLEKRKLRLVGVPHIITRVTYRPGVPDKSAPSGLKDYVSLEAVIADDDTLGEAVGRGWMPNVSSIDQLPFRAEEHIVYNDGGTGVRRQVTMILRNCGLLDIGEVNEDRDFDKPFYDWKSFEQSSEMNDDAGGKIIVPDFVMAPDGGPFAILAFHGLRVSHMAEFDTDVFYLS